MAAVERERPDGGARLAKAPDVAVELRRPVYHSSRSPRQTSADRTRASAAASISGGMSPPTAMTPSTAAAMPRSRAKRHRHALREPGEHQTRGAPGHSRDDLVHDAGDVGEVVGDRQLAILPRHPARDDLVRRAAGRNDAVPGSATSRQRAAPGIARMRSSCDSAPSAVAVKAERGPAPRAVAGGSIRYRPCVAGRDRAFDHQITLTVPEPRMSASRVMSGSPTVCAGAQISASNGSRVKRSSSATKTCLGRDVERLIRRVAEQIVEEGANGAPQVDARHARQQAALPDDAVGHVENRVAPLAAIEERGGAGPELAAARGVKHERVRVGHRGLRISHGALSSAPPASRYSSRRFLTISGRPSDVSNMPRNASSARSSSGSLAIDVDGPDDRPRRPDPAGFARRGHELIEQLADAPQTGSARPAFQPGEVVGCRASRRLPAWPYMFIRYSLKAASSCMLLAANAATRPSPARKFSRR